MDDDLTAELADELLDIVDGLYKATERAVALLKRLRDAEAPHGHPGGQSGATVLTFPTDDPA